MGDCEGPGHAAGPFRVCGTVLCVRGRASGQDLSVRFSKIDSMTVRSFSMA